MKDKSGKIRTAVILAMFFCLAFIGLAAVYLSIDDLPAVIRIGYAVLMLALAAGMITVLKERIREIRKGEEDDLDNY